jgi:hypothetical protein
MSSRWGKGKGWHAAIPSGKNTCQTSDNVLSIEINEGVNPFSRAHLSLANGEIFRGSNGNTPISP